MVTTTARPAAAQAPRRRPWWHSPGKVAVACVAAFVLGAGIVGAASRPYRPGASSVDVGFLQDMRWHHDQAVAMSMVFVRKQGTDATVRQIANEVVLSQQLEAGAMVELLHSFKAAEANETDVAMAWMAPTMATTTPDAMPGMATPDQLTQLAAATGHDADVLFLQLMIAHHTGGIHMADFTAQHAKVARVREIALAMSRNQATEIHEMELLQGKLGG